LLNSKRRKTYARIQAIEGQADTPTWWKSCWGLQNSTTVSAFKIIAKDSLPVGCKSNPEAWVAQVTFHDWFLHHFVYEATKYCKENNLQIKILL
jgi:hypothetical protein